MPAFYTHRYFAQQVYAQFSPNLKKALDYDYFLLFAQSFDILFYNYGQNKWLSQLGHQAHQKNTQAFFLNTLNYIQNSQDKDNQKYFLSFFYGSLTHYILDATFHPYIFYKTGLFKPKEKATYKYKGKHTYLEMEIDKYLYDKNHDIPFFKAKLYKIYDNIKPNEALTELISEIFSKTFYKDNIGMFYFQSLKKWRFIHKYFKYDRFGLKKFIYKLIDSLPLSIKLQNYSLHLAKINMDDLNLQHEKWLNPADKNIKSTQSVDDLTETAIHKYLEIIKNLNKITNLRTAEFPIPNISYYSGLDLNEKKKLQYFEN